HLSSVVELCRVAREVRIFPLLDMSGKESAHIEPVVSELKNKGYGVDFVRTAYQFQKGADMMMRVAAEGGA
ncbi:MAG: SAM-dependent methyltransferase, partial [Acidobacteria bacterium]|nr:SAM-dependent methyltransferase [Acidobacteriota bacterium]